MTNTFYKPKNEFGELLASENFINSKIADEISAREEETIKIYEDINSIYKHINEVPFYKFEELPGSNLTIEEYILSNKINNNSLTPDELKIELSKTIYLRPINKNEFEEYICLNPDAYNSITFANARFNRIGSGEASIASISRLGSVSLFCDDVYEFNDEQWNNLYPKPILNDGSEGTPSPKEGLAVAPYILRKFVQKDKQAENDIDIINKNINNISSDIEKINKELGGILEDNTAENQGSEIENLKQEIIDIKSFNDSQQLIISQNTNTITQHSDDLDNLKTAIGISNCENDVECSIFCRLDDISERLNSNDENDANIDIRVVDLEEKILTITDNTLRIDNIDEAVTELNAKIISNTDELNKINNTIGDKENLVEGTIQHDISLINSEIKRIDKINEINKNASNIEVIQEELKNLTEETSSNNTSLLNYINILESEDEKINKNIAAFKDEVGAPTKNDVTLWELAEDTAAFALRNKSDIDNYKSLIETNTNNITKNTGDIGYVKGEFNTFKTNINNVLNSLRSSIDTNSANISTNSTNISTNSANITSQDKRIEIVENDIKSINAKIPSDWTQTTFTSTKTLAEQNKNKVESCINDITSHTEIINSHDTRITLLENNNISDIEADIENIKDDINKIDFTTLSNITVNFANINNEISNLNKSISDKASKEDLAESKLELSDVINQNAGNIIELTSRISALDNSENGAISNIKSDIEKNSNNIEDLKENTIKNLDNRIVSLEESSVTKDSYNEKIESIKEDIINNTNGISALDQRVDDVYNTVNALVAGKETLSSEVSGIKTVSSEHSVQIAALEEKSNEISDILVQTANSNLANNVLIKCQLDGDDPNTEINEGRAELSFNAIANKLGLNPNDLEIMVTGVRLSYGDSIFHDEHITTEISYVDGGDKGRLIYIDFSGYENPHTILVSITYSITSNIIEL